jgi:hypothetical protein
MIKVFTKLTDSQKKELKSGVIEVSGKAMNRTALGVVDAIFTLYPKISFNELKEMLPDKINPSAPKNFKSIFKPFTNKNYGVFQPLSIKTEIEKNGYDINSTHFTKEEEMFTTSDGTKIIVSKLWESNDTETGENDLQNLIYHVSNYGIRVVQVEKKENFNKGEYNLKIINKTLFDELQTVKKKWNYLWLLILVIIIIISIIYIKK